MSLLRKKDPLEIKVVIRECKAARSQTEMLLQMDRSSSEETDQETKLSNLAGAASEVRRLRSKLVLSLETYAYNAGPIAEAIDLVEVLNVLIAKAEGQYAGVNSKCKTCSTVLEPVEALACCGAIFCFECSLNAANLTFCCPSCKKAYERGGGATFDSKWPSGTARAESFEFSAGRELNGEKFRSKRAQETAPQPTSATCIPEAHAASARDTAIAKKKKKVFALLDEVLEEDAPPDRQKGTKGRGRGRERTLFDCDFKEKEQGPQGASRAAESNATDGHQGRPVGFGTPRANAQEVAFGGGALAVLGGGASHKAPFKPPRKLGPEK